MSVRRFGQELRFQKLGPVIMVVVVVMAMAVTRVASRTFHLG
jgi:hypothetical protein